MTGLVRREAGFFLYQAEDRRTWIECRFEDETIWLTQGHVAPTGGLRSTQSSVTDAKHATSEVA